MTQYATFAVALLTITNPIGAMAIFAGIVGDRPPQDRSAPASGSFPGSWAWS